MSDLEKLLEALQTTPEQIIQVLLYNGKIDMVTSIKFYRGEITLEEILKSTKDDTRIG